MKKKGIGLIFALIIMLFAAGENRCIGYAKEMVPEEVEILEESILDEAEEIEKQHLKEELQNIVPQIEVKDAYDKYITLQMGVPQEILLPENMLYYYEIKVSLNKGNEVVEKSFFFEKEENNSQIVQLEMQEGFLQDEELWTYEIEVKLISRQPETESEVNTAAVTEEESEVSVLSDIVAEPYYESKITLKAKTTSVYTTQKEVPIALVKFSKLTTVRDNLIIEDITYNKDENKHMALESMYMGEDGVIYASAGASTALGKHTIQVMAYAPEGMYASRTTIAVTVKQGIEEGMLDVEVPSDTLYKPDEKNITFNAKVVFTKDAESQKEAKTKKVVWEVLSVDKEVLTEESALYGYIMIKNGKVTINKNYVVSENPKENCFVIKVTAADFTGNTVCAYSKEIEITKEVTEAGEVAIIKTDENGNAYEIVRSDSKVTSDQLGKVVVFKKDAPVKDDYSKSELELYTFSNQNLTFKASNTAIKIGKDGEVTVSKPVKNAKITVQINDNSKQKVVLKKLTIDYDKPFELGLKIEQIDENGLASAIGEISSENKEYELNTLTDSRVRITVMKKASEDEEWEEVDALINYKLIMPEGITVKKSGLYNQFYDFYINKKEAVIKLNDKSNKRTISYTIINNSYLTGKAPKLSVKGSLKAAAYEKEQSITYILKKNGNFEYDPYKKYVWITANSADKYKNETSLKNYTDFENVMGGFGYREIHNNQFVLEFNSDKENPLQAGKYKLWFIFGKLNENGEFIPDTQKTAVVINVKKVELPKGSYKLVTDYNISVKEGGRVSLKGSGKNYLAESVEYLELKNANVKGSPNYFTDFFDIKENKLIVKEDLTEEQLDYIRSSAAKSNWSGYVEYKVTLGNSDGSYYEQFGTSKINLTVKETVRKFKIEKKQETNNKKETSAKVYADNKEVNILFAYITKGAYTIEADGTSEVKLIPKTGNEKPVGGINKLTVYVVPKGTYNPFKIKLEELKEEWDKALDEKQVLEQKFAKASKEEKITLEQQIETAKEKCEKAEVAFSQAIKQYGIKVSASVELPQVDNIEYVKKVVELVNKERAKKNLKALVMDDEINIAAFKRAKEIAKVFSHSRPDGSNCFTVLNEYDISYRSAGENIAMGYSSPESVVNGWMNSPGHRANILNSSYTHIGVGCYEENGYYHWVQLFVGR